MFSRNDALEWNYCVLWMYNTTIVPSSQKLGTILGNKMFQKRYCKNVLLNWFLKLKIDFESQILTLFDSYPLSVQTFGQKST